MTERRRDLAVAEATGIEGQRRELARYDARIMYLGFASTATWVTASLWVGGWLYDLLVAKGLGGGTAFLLATVASVGVFRFLVLRVYGRIRERWRRRRAAAFDRARLPPAAAHLSPALAKIVIDLRALRTVILAPDEPASAVIDRLRAWILAVDRLEADDRERVRDRGLDLSPLLPLLRLSRMSGEARAVWADRAYRRLQAAVPVLDHFEEQLTRMRDDAYR